MTKSKFLLLAFLLVIFNQATYAQTLPAKVKSYLDKNYSGWNTNFAEADTCFSKEKRIETGDFNGDKKRDYAVLFVKGRKGYVIAFVSQGAAYKSHILENTSALEASTLILGVYKKGARYSDEIPRLSNDAPYTIPCSSDAEAIYIYKNGRFQ